MTMSPTESFTTDAAIVAATARLSLPRPDHPPTPIVDAAPETRHVLIVEPDGWTYVAPHLPDGRRSAVCKSVGRAAYTFLERGTPPGPGRYWCDVSPDGNFEIGGRVRA